MNTAQRIAEIRRRLESALEPESLMIEDQGHLHVGHEGARDGRGHFRVMIVADAFDGMSMVARHRAIYAALGGLMDSDIHALAIEAVASSEL
ncbi:MAG: BolA family transcriptional regulator [Gammaproteobacteria bacterium]|nr:BolA family transcriptional regulator [Gammaproteobacteria bacterium]